MENFHHKPIKRFTLDGIFQDDSSIVRLKNEYIRLLKTEMVLTGYVPRLDIDTDFTIYNKKKKDVFEFMISLYGTYLGKKQAQCIEGIDGTVAIPLQKSKLQEYSEEQA
jgi:hypothetical protein